MRIYHDSLLHAASDLNAFLGCPHAVAFNFQKLRHPSSLPARAVDDESMVLIQDAGHAHEANYLIQLKLLGDVAEISTDGSLEQRAAATAHAMRLGAQFIYQATFFEPPWHGFADFLRRVETPSALGPYSYEVIDTKLSRTPDPKHVMQLGLYSDMIANVQGLMPHGMHLVLGDGKEANFRKIEFSQTLDVAKSRYLNFIDSGATDTTAEPCSACKLCGWREVCAAQWEADDHLSRVAGMQKSQIQKFRNAGISTLAALGALAPDTHVPKLAPRTFERLRAQAALQLARRDGEPTVELIPFEPQHGFLRLPQPNPHDLFFDLEGDPLYPDGLEYLWGVHYRDDKGTPRFRHVWGHNRDAERAAFESSVDWFTEHLARHPGAHIYHYAPYEVTVLRRLSTAFASREDAVDNLLRAEKLVDLYAISRAAIRTSEPDLSLKTLELFFAEKRLEDVTKAGQSIVHYHRWRDTGEQALLDGLLAYNKVDCENTEGLRDWLLNLRPDLPWWTKPGPEIEPELSPEAADREARRAALRDAIRHNAIRLSERGRELVAHLVDFHTRAKKPEQWAIFDRCNREEDELINDGECIGSITPNGPDFLRPDKRSIIASYRFPEQDSKLGLGKEVLHAPTREKLGKIVNLDRDTGIVEVRRGAKVATPWPDGGSIIPG